MVIIDNSGIRSNGRFLNTQRVLYFQSMSILPGRTAPFPASMSATRALRWDASSRVSILSMRTS